MQPIQHLLRASNLTVHMTSDLAWSQHSAFGSLSLSSLALVVSLIAAFLIVLIVVSIVLVKTVFKLNYQAKFAAASKSNPSSVIAIGKLSKKSERELKLEFELIREQVNALEAQVRPVCTQLYQQLHNDFLTELNNDLIYKIYNLSYTNALPIWNFKTYMYNIFFHSASYAFGRGSYGGLNSAADAHATAKYDSNNFMSSSSMSNSTTNTLLSSTLTPKQQQILNSQQQQQQQQQQQSVYATIKSSSGLKLEPIIDGGCGTLLISQTAARHQELLLHGSIGEAMFLFDQLLNNKNFLFTFLQQIERTPALMSTVDKRNFLGMLTLALRHNLSYLYSIIKLVLSDHISNAFRTRTHKNLFKPKANESVADILVANWISLFMYAFQRDTQCSLELYRLVQCLKFYLHMAPCDQTRHLALNTLNEHTYLDPGELLPTHQHFQTLYVNLLVNNDSKTLLTVSLLDCDTIHQAKQKCLEAVFKSNLNLAQFNLVYRPSLVQCDLELCLVLIKNDETSAAASQQTTTFVSLKETEDELMINNNNNNKNLSSQQSDEPKRLLTLKDYNMQSGSFVNLSFKDKLQPSSNNSGSDDQANHVYMSTLSMSNEYVLYGGGGGGQPPPPPPPPPVKPPKVDPPMLNDKNRFHLMKPVSGHSTNTTNSTRSTTAQSSSSSSSSGGKKTVKQKKYEKSGNNGTVKSQDSAATATVSLIQSAPSSSSPSPTPSANNGNNKTSVLARLLVNKGTLQPFIDQFVETLFANTANLPPIIQHLFAFFDSEIERNQHLLNSSSSGSKSSALNEAERDALARDWKAQCYFVKYWLSVLRQPDFLLDVSVSDLLASNLECIAAALGDGLDPQATMFQLLYDNSSSSSGNKSPTNRLLFLNDIPKYRQMVSAFFAELKANSHSAVSDHELYFYLNEFSKINNQDFGAQALDATINNQLGLNINAQCQQTRTIAGLGSSVEIELSPVQNLIRVYEVYEKFEAQINADLGQQQCSVLLPVHHRLVQIKELMSNGGNGGGGGAVQNTMSRVFQQQTSQHIYHQSMSLSPMNMNTMGHHHHQHVLQPPVLATSHRLTLGQQQPAWAE